MKIEYKTVDFVSESIELDNVVDIKINGIKIVETENGLRLSVDDQIIVIPKASNMIEVESKENLFS